VNRVFRDKPHGLVVDYIGIGEELKEATNRYAKGGGKGDPAPDINDEAVAVFNECLAASRDALPEGKDYGSWRRMTSVECEDLYAYVYGTLIDDDEARNIFLEAEVRLTNAFILVRHLSSCKKYADEVIFCQRVRKQLRKVEDRKKKQHRIDNAVRDLVDDAVDTEGVVDIFKVAGIEKPDISILDEKFLQTFHNRNENMNLRVELLHRLLEDKISAVFSRNAAQKKNFSDLLRDTIARYHNRIIDGAAVIKAIIEMKKQMEENEKRAQMLHLSEEELSFYDAISQNRNTIYDSDFLCSIVHDVVQVIKNNLKVDWTQPHREDVKAGIRSAIKRVLRTRNVTVEDFEPLIKSIMTQAESMYADWPGAA
jgi:type I restriction enzyme R subunit